MNPSNIESTERFTLLCLRCHGAVLCRREWIGKEVRCPHCGSVVRIVAPDPSGAIATTDGPTLTPKKAFNFPCPQCDCLLAAHSGMSGQPASCPTCASRFVVPHLKRGGTPAPAETLEAASEQPAALHAYAASGSRAPRIERMGEQILIICPNCQARNTIDADACASCAAPFTIDGAQTMGKLERANFGARSLTAGVLSVFLFPLMVPGMAAVYFGWRSVFRTGERGVPVSGLVGLVLGACSIAGGASFWLLR